MHVRSRRDRSRRRGVEIVEFALILPAVLAVLMGIVEMGWMVKNQLTLANAARDSVRYAALGGSATSTIARVESDAAVLNPGLTDAQITLEQSADKTSLTPTYTAWPADTNGKNGVTVGNIVRIRISYPNHSLTGFFSFLQGRNLSVAITMLREAN